MGTRRHAAVALLALVAALGSGGCGESYGHALDRLQPRYDQLRARLRVLAQHLPPQGSLSDERAATLAPPPVVGGPTDNADLVPFEALSDPSVEPALDLGLSRTLVGGLRATVHPRPLAAALLQERDPQRVRELEAALALRWLVVVRVVENEPPLAFDDKTFRGGRVRLEAFVVDLPAGSVVAALPLEARTPARLDYSYKRRGDDPRTRLVEAARAALHREVRARLAEGLHRVTGGTFRLD